MQIKDCAAIVSGGASGLGFATAQMLRAQGAKVALFDINDDAGNAAAAEIGCLFCKVDVSDDASAAEAIEKAEQAHGVARVLVNCAGIAPAAKTVGRENQPHSLDVFRKTIEVNLIGTFNLLSKFAARLSAAEPIGEERGVAVNTASAAAFEGQIGQVAYAASKGGVVGLMVPAARDLAPLKIRVMTIAPGLFLTPMLKGLPQATQDSLGQQVPHPNRLGKPEEYAQLVQSIIENPMLNGTVIRLDGAIRMAPR